jgi:hypothetical protein
MRIILAFALALSLASCATNPIANSTLYSAKLTFDASLKTFIAFKNACAAKALPSACRTYVVKGQGIVAKAYAAEKIANSAAMASAVNELSGVIAALGNLRQ